MLTVFKNIMNLKLIALSGFAGLVIASAAPIAQAADVAAADPSVVAHCPMQFPSQGLCATLFFDVPPVVGQEAKFHVLFRSVASGLPAEPVGDVSLRLWMPDMGHGSAPVTIVHGAGVGTFDISKAYFVMDGNWEIHVELKNGATVESAFVVELL